MILPHPPRAAWQNLEAFLGVTTRGWEDAPGYQSVEGGGEGCLKVQASSQRMNDTAPMSGTPWLGDPVLGPKPVCLTSLTPDRTTHLTSWSAWYF